MKRCNYCSQENEDHSPVCIECGMALPTAVEAAEGNNVRGRPPLIQLEGQLSAGNATAILLAYLGTQAFVGFVFGVGVVILSQIQGKNLQDPRQAAELIQTLKAPALT